ncbi:MAG: polysaccharide pyruvyl transferase family protein [Deltaproteobacteria bacterium]|jgi:exopolysaccharide biosynthesis predicted pyruvyltransferase EpsI|nr:polysaccharide pyruvyl transferase family protein [Deltaproteobacteria bacterium]
MQKLEKILATFYRIIRSKQNEMCKKIHFARIPVWKIKFCTNSTINQVLRNNFSPFNVDNTAILNKLRQLQPFTFIPDPGNCGDMLLSSATLNFFDANNLQYKIYDWKYFSKNSENIVYGGGGIWIPNYNSVWIKEFLPIFQKAKNVVILPSSFNNCPELVSVLDSRFILFCREKKSYDYLIAQKTPATIILDHDMAFRATDQIISDHCEKINKETVDSLQKTFPLLFGKEIKFMRTDSESTGNYTTDLDLSRVFGSSRPTRAQAIFGANLMLVTVSCFNIIHTDRLHVAIASTLMGKTVYMHDNSYGKLSGVYQQSMSYRKNVHFIK